MATHPPRYIGPEILQDTVYKWVVCILLECFLVLFNDFCSLYIYIVGILFFVIRLFSNLQMTKIIGNIEDFSIFSSAACGKVSK